MFCPRCAAHNIDDARFCRACGADISLIPQALAGSAPDSRAATSKDSEALARAEESAAPPTLASGYENLFKGLAFLLIVVIGFIFFRSAIFFWVWFIIPALGNIGKGIGQMKSAGEAARRLPHTFTFDETHLPPRARLAELPSHAAQEFERQPSSVTEATTRHLDDSDVSLSNATTKDLEER